MDKPFPFSRAVVRCADMDCLDRYRFTFAGEGPDGVELREILDDEGIDETIVFTFAPNALESGGSVLSMSQTNAVTEEETHRLDDTGQRRMRLADTTPPFLLSRRLAAEGASGAIAHIGFHDHLGREAGLVRDGNEAFTLVVRGEEVTVQAERYAGGDSGDFLLLLGRELAPFPDWPIVLHLARGDREFSVTLEQLD